MARVVKQEEISAFTFLGLLASEGQVPRTTAQSADKLILSVAAEEVVREAVSDYTAKGDFFSLMVENGQMRGEEPVKKYSIKIVRPTGLGGGFGGGFGGIGGGAVPAH